jgi:hypothetical protein
MLKTKKILFFALGLLSSGAQAYALPDYISRHPMALGLVGVGLSAAAYDLLVEYPQWCAKKYPRTVNSKHTSYSLLKFAKYYFQLKGSSLAKLLRLVTGGSLAAAGLLLLLPRMEIIAHTTQKRKRLVTSQAGADSAPADLDTLSDKDAGSCRRPAACAPQPNRPSPAGLPSVTPQIGPAAPTDLAEQTASPPPAARAAPSSAASFAPAGVDSSPETRIFSDSSSQRNAELRHFQVNIKFILDATEVMFRNRVFLARGNGILQASAAQEHRKKLLALEHLHAAGLLNYSEKRLLLQTAEELKKSMVRYAYSGSNLSPQLVEVFEQELCSAIVDIKIALRI